MLKFHLLIGEDGDEFCGTFGLLGGDTVVHGREGRVVDPELVPAVHLLSLS